MDADGSQDDPDYFLILRDVSELDLDMLFEHTRRLREKRERSSKRQAGVLKPGVSSNTADPLPESVAKHASKPVVILRRLKSLVERKKGPQRKLDSQSGPEKPPLQTQSTRPETNGLPRSSAVKRAGEDEDDSDEGKAVTTNGKVANEEVVKQLMEKWTIVKAAERGPKAVEAEGREDVKETNHPPQNV